mmetsp:Transcript_10786/g.26643  ORF Transcript_10786/g.26643 Transcript_10786/m.26643 type:complete len:314 (-) Transcript_10786:204-1145(-)|eukprot:CAMPEP_0181121466 /NCGR_PEP_ID=MMETSP1071-20121207/24757_1 /TAXON_ID=35127 /ORGANISM="Thalassiosira sp., Strain NH16" /LENGTH=313 /DNA_ID=CAMNT_0023206295 /DNA_START=129 /DNA_END=1070 /DNA_ORIENTATION=-
MAEVDVPQEQVKVVQIAEETEKEPQDKVTDVEAPPADMKRGAKLNQGSGRKNRASTMTLLTVDNSKSFYNHDYKKEHIGESREYWRDMILGVNDGLVSTFLLVTGVYGSGMDAKDILLTSISGTVAGAISMAAGEYVATKTQEEVKRAECALEEKAVKEHKKDELRFLNDLLTSIGIPEADDNESEEFKVRRTLLGYYEKNDAAHVKINVALAFGDVESSQRSPYIAGLTAFFLFTVGAMSSVIPFAVTDNKQSALIASFVATMVLILLVGGVKTWATKGVWWVSALENLIITAGGGGIAYGIGVGFDSLVHK